MWGPRWTGGRSQLQPQPPAPAAEPAGRGQRACQQTPTPPTPPGWGLCKSSSLKMVPSHSAGRPVPARTACTVMAGDLQSCRPRGSHQRPSKSFSFALGAAASGTQEAVRRQEGSGSAGRLRLAMSIRRCATGAGASGWPRGAGRLRRAACRVCGPVSMTASTPGAAQPGLGAVRQGETAPLAADVCLDPLLPRPPRGLGLGRAAAPTPALPLTGLWVQAELPL